MIAWVVNYRLHLCLAREFRAFSASHQPHLLLSSPIFRIFFQVPYPATPLFATLTKTAGVCTSNSHSGTHRSRNYLCHRLPTVHRRTHVLSFHTLAHSF